MFAVPFQGRCSVRQEDLYQVGDRDVQVLRLTLQPLPDWGAACEAYRDVDILLYVARHHLLSHRARRCWARAA